MKKIKLTFKLVLVLIIYLLLSPMSSYLLEKEEREYQVLDRIPEGWKTIVVLGSGGTPDSSLTEFQRLGESALLRVLEGVRLWNFCENCMLVFSSAGKEGYPSQASVYADVAIAMGVDSQKVRLLERGLNTESEAEDFIAEFPQTEKIILVSSAAHLKRASYIFKHLGLDCLPAPAQFHIKIHPVGHNYSFLPSFSAAERWNILFHEWLGLVWFKFKVYFDLVE